MFRLFCPETAGKTLVLLNGQSNANTFTYAAVQQCLSDAPPAGGYETAHFWRSGNQLSRWIDGDGTKGPNWSPMMDDYYAAVDSCRDSGEEIAAVKLLHFQGEADVQNSGTFDALQSGQPSKYVEKLRTFISTFTSEMGSYSGVQPQIALSLVAFDRNHPTFVNLSTLTDEACDLIRAEMQQVSDEFANVGTFETDGLPRRDHVHLNHFPVEGDSMKIAAERALAA